jgi:hypothetical protein
MMGLPAAFPVGAAGLFQGVEKFKPRKGIPGSGQRIPGVLAHIFDGIHEAEQIFVRRRR